MGKPFVLNWCMHMERTHTLGMAMAPTLRQNINHNDSFQIKNTTNYNEYQLNWTERYFSRKKSTQIRIWNDGCLWDTEITSSSFQSTHINHWCWRCYVWKSNTNQWHGFAWHQREWNEMKWMKQVDDDEVDVDSSSSWRNKKNCSVQLSSLDHSTEQLETKWKVVILFNIGLT